MGKPKVSMRKPPTLDVEAFVSGAKTSKRSSARKSGDVKPRAAVVERADGRELRRMTIYLPVPLAKRLAMRCAEDDRDTSDVIADAVAKLLGA